MVGRQQVSVFVIEGQTNERLFEDTAILISHFLFFLFKQDLFGTVCQGAEDVYGTYAGIRIFGDAPVFHISPLSKFLNAADIPSEDTLVCLPVPGCQAFDELCVDGAVVRMYQFKTVLIPHTFIG